MGVQSTNFEFLRASDERLARLAGDAERYFASDASVALVKLRAMGERLVRLVAAHQALSFNSGLSFDDVLRALRTRSLLPPRACEILYHVKRVGNAAAHEDAGTIGEALTALRMMREAAVWFIRTYGGSPNFKAGPFVPPAPPADRTADLSAQLADLRAAVLASKDAEAKAALIAQEAEAARLAALDAAAREREERAFWERDAVETEQSEKAAQAELAPARAERAEVASSVGRH